VTLNVDFGDVVLSVGLHVKGRLRRRFGLHVGVPSPTTPEDRVVRGTPRPVDLERIEIVMDLAADMQVPLTGNWTDEVGNPVPAPTDAVVTYTNDNPTVINLTDNGDGSAVAAATGTLSDSAGPANIHADAVAAGETLSADLQIVVVAGLGERFEIVAGTPTEVTPDT
jgi:hypothetical protein